MKDLNNKQRFLDDVWQLKPQIDEIASKYIEPINPEFDSLKKYLDNGDYISVHYLLNTLVFDTQDIHYNELINLNFHSILELSNRKLTKIEVVNKIMTLEDIKAIAAAKKNSGITSPVITRKKAVVKQIIPQVIEAKVIETPIEEVPVQVSSNGIIRIKPRGKKKRIIN